MKKFQSMLFAVAALALSLSGFAIAQTRVVDDAPPRGEFRSYWPQPMLEPIVVAQAETSRWGAGVVVDDAPPRGVFRSYWPQPMLEPIVVAQTTAGTGVTPQPAAKPIHKLASKYTGTWKRAGDGGRDREAEMSFEVSSQTGTKAVGKLTSYAFGNSIASTCFAVYDEPFESEFIPEEKAWKLIVNTARCGKWDYTLIVENDGRLTGQRKRETATTYYELKPVGTVTAGVSQ